MKVKNFLMASVKRMNVNRVSLPLGDDMRKYLTRQKGAFILEREPNLLDQVRQAIRTRHYSLRPEETYVQRL